MTTKTLLLPALLLLTPALAWSAPSSASALFGGPAPHATVTRTVELTPGMKRVTVASGESVAFRAGEQTVDWTFLQSINGSAMNLAVLMPGAPQARDVYVFIKPSEVYSAG